ncbi:tetratricopeptide repeat protein [Nannocystis pusilla]|uniref:tetratricopeptide repeat protein n=1 Tax=Nannocystis pusilla TaxID=889268 RepID=UPI003B81E94B
MSLRTCLTGLLFVLACDKPAGETTPPGKTAAGEPDATWQPEAVDKPAEAAADDKAPAKKNRDRDPEEERRKLAASHQQSQQAGQSLRQGDLARALDLSREALRIHEQNVDAMLVMAEAFLKQGKHELTQTVTSSALAVDTKIITPEETSRAYNLKGFAYLAADKPTLATQSFRKAAETDAGNATAWNNLGAQYLRTGNFKTAAECFVYALKLDPNFFKAHLNHGSSLRALGDVVGAEKAYQTALRLRSDYPDAHFDLGVLYLDAPEFPGLDVTTRLQRALIHLGKYRDLALAAGGSTAKEIASPTISPGSNARPAPINPVLPRARSR